MADFLTDEEKRALQLKELEVLKELRRLCDKHGLRYYLTAGTLLGAVRHKGFIPWDDDVDIVMPRRDYNRLKKIARRELSEGFFYQSADTEYKCPFFFTKIRMDGTSVTEPLLEGVKIHDGCYVDVFPLDVCPMSDRRAERYFKLTRMIFCAIIARLNPDFVCEYTKGGAIFAFKLLRRMPIWLLKWLRGSVRRYYSLFSRRGRLATVDGSYGFPRESYDIEWFDEAVSLEFEGESFIAPKRYDDILTHMYGDYMTPPDESMRHGHFIKNDKEENEQ